MDIAIVIVNWNGRELLADCLHSVEISTGGLRVATVVVDNGSTDGSQAMLRARFPNVQLINSACNLGFGGGNNLVLQQLLDAPDAPEFVVLLNPDTVIHPGALHELVQAMREQPHLGIAGARLLNPDGSFQFGHARFPTLLHEALILTGVGRKLYGSCYPSVAPQPDAPTDDAAEYVMGACMVVRTTALRDVGLFDEGFFMYSEEVDWCYRFRAAGWAVGYVSRAHITHVGGGSTCLVRPQMQAELYRSRVRFFRKHRNRSAVLGLRGLLVLMHAAKTLRAALPRRGATGTPPLSSALLRHALFVSRGDA